VEECFLGNVADALWAAVPVQEESKHSVLRDKLTVQVDHGPCGIAGGNCFSSRQDVHTSDRSVREQSMKGVKAVPGKRIGLDTWHYREACTHGSVG
jgi:hypothetical protein